MKILQVNTSIHYQFINEDFVKDENKMRSLNTKCSYNRNSPEKYFPPCVS
jgi:hypothetical protein